ncbi:hypothetical protein [Herbaspirillum huttiense]|uniref:hypothetical protein n=1 Tax=Herbaspirillum huttiense TaxID=863372 RepID=UPI002176D7EB|nr:hypothetical protein [Herbaspirillum huttiense]UWE19015.1 hypothetical protein NY669_12795 [Herbaspirillum huttiense]
MEETLRNYFLSLGYYVVRGVPVTYHLFDVTDVDLWLYSRTSALTRQRANVDIKNKKTPQAIERIFWAKGLSSILGLDGCIVATTDTRPDVKQFGLKHKIPVLDGNFVAKLSSKTVPAYSRLSEEEFIELADKLSLGKLGGNWKAKYLEAKARLLSDLNFDGCNAYLSDIQYFLEEYLKSSQQNKDILRFVYVTLSMFVVALDFVMKDYSTFETEGRFDLLVEGFRYGESGKKFTARFAEITATLTDAANLGKGAGEVLRSELVRQAENIPAEILADFFSKLSVQQTLFGIAVEFERAAFDLDSKIVSPSVTSTLAVILDFLGIDRKKILT